MKLSTENLVIAPDAAIDLQVHTHYSDGEWTPEALIGHLVSEGFGLAAITDHDRPDIAPMLQQIAIDKGLALLVAVEMTTTWRGEMTDVLCYGFDMQKQALNTLAADVLRRQQANTQQVYDKLVGDGCVLPADELAIILGKPAAQQPHELVPYLKRHGYGLGEVSAGRMLLEAGFAFQTNEIGAVVEAAHADGAVCLIAHPGRGDGFPLFDADLFDQLRAEVPIDGFEVYYPAHSGEQVAAYEAYANKHGLLTSSGSDSHRPDKPPIKYRAELSRKLLERLGITVKS